MKLLFILFFIQLGFSQDSLVDKLTDTITLDDNFIKQLSNNENRDLKISSFTFKINLEKVIRKKLYNEVSVNVLFRNITKSLIYITSIKGGSNYVASEYRFYLLPNTEKTITMFFACSKHKHLSRVFRFVVHLPEKEIVRVFKKHNFDFFEKNSKQQDLQSTKTR